jgi:hypothetical protein
MLFSPYGSQRLLVARHVHSCISSRITAVVFAKRIPFQQASSTALNAEASKPNDPQVFALGYSPKLDLFEAIPEATEIALQTLAESYARLCDCLWHDYSFILVRWTIIAKYSCSSSTE